MNILTDWLIGFGGSVLMAGLAYKKRSLSLSGAIAAMVMGTVYYGSGSMLWFGLLLTFFITSTFWSKWKKRAKSRFDHIYEKGGRRDAAQVFANGGIGMLLCLANAIFPHPAWILFFLGVMGTVNADTWATEIGSLSRTAPRSILSGKQVPAGTSGAISPVGTLATVIGAGVIGIAAAILLYMASDPALAYPYTWKLLMGLAICALIGGTVGAFTDSFLGATIQASYHCEQCGGVTEKVVHCNAPSQLARGKRWMTNDLVNAFSSLLGGATAWLIGYLFVF